MLDQSLSQSQDKRTCSMISNVFYNGQKYPSKLCDLHAWVTARKSKRPVGFEVFFFFRIINAKIRSLPIRWAYKITFTHAATNYRYINHRGRDGRGTVFLHLGSCCIRRFDACTSPNSFRCMKNALRLKSRLFLMHSMTPRSCMIYYKSRGVRAAKQTDTCVDYTHNEGINFHLVATNWPLILISEHVIYVIEKYCHN